MLLTMIERETGHAYYTGEVEDGEHFIHLMMIGTAHNVTQETRVIALMDDGEEMSLIDPAERARETIRGQVIDTHGDTDFTDAMVEVLLLDMCAEFLRKLDAEMENIGTDALDNILRSLGSDDDEDGAE